MAKIKRKKVFKEILRVIMLVIAGFLIGINVYLFNASQIVGNSLPMPFGVGAAVVLSGSMEPELSVNDLIFVKKSDNYEVGDIVVFKDNRGLITHRIISKSGDTVTTKGEANPSPDSPIKSEQISGRVVGHIGGAGAIINVLKNPLGIILVLALALVLLEMSYKKDKEEHREKLKILLAELKELQKDDSEKSDIQ